jgi:hypothetical protein
MGIATVDASDECRLRTPVVTATKPTPNIGDIHTL